MFARKAFYVLLWKECRVIMPLALGVSLLAILLYAVTLASPGERSGVFFGYLMLLPNLVAFGVSALQVGHEDETGTLQWQRSLPVRVRAVFFSKWLVAMLGIFIVWLTCLACFGVVVQTGNFDRLPAGLINTGFGIELELIRLFTFTLMLFACSLLTSWLVRAPAFGLILAALLTGLAVALTINLGQTSDSYFSGSPEYQGSTAAWVSGYQMLIALSLTIMSYWFAARRWAKTSAIPMPGFARTTAHPAYVPAVAIPSAPPSMKWALLWQSFRQSRWIYTAVLALMGLAIANHFFSLARNRPPSADGWIFVAAVVSASLLGISTFIGDSTKQRYRFLADHGIPRFTIWWTRMFVPAGMCAGLILLLFMFLQADNRTLEIPAMVTVLAACFVTGSMSSMWARRPVVGYFGAPILFIVGLINFSSVLQYYEAFAWTAGLGVLVLAGCGFRMVRRWSEGDRGFGYHARFVGWYGLAGLVVISPIFLYRIWTTPSEMKDWRQRTFVASGSLKFEDVSAKPLEFTSVRVRYVDLNNFVLTDDSYPNLARAIEQADTDSPILLHPNEGGYQLQNLLSLIRERGEPIRTGDDPEQSYEELMTLLFSSINELSGRPLPLYTSHYLDSLEVSAAAELGLPASRELLGNERWKSFAAQLRSPEQRMTDRKASLLVSWRHANSSGAVSTHGSLGPWIPVSTGAKFLSFYESYEKSGVNAFGGYGLYSPRSNAFTFERRRDGRNLDLATRLSLEQVETTALPQPDSKEELRRRNAWKSSSLNDPTVYWNTVYEGIVERVRLQAVDQ